MIKECDYKVLMTFGGGGWNSLTDSYRILFVKDKRFKSQDFMRIIHKLLSYGWIRGQREGINVKNYASRFGITQKGSDALEFYKGMRYHHTDKKALLSAEGKAMITLPGQRYNIHEQFKKEI